MPETFIPTNPATVPGGKKLKSFENVDVNGDTVDSEAVVLVNSAGVEVVAASEATQASILANLQTLNSLVPTKYDYVEMSYVGDNVTTVVYKLGGAGGGVVSTLTLAYAGTNLISVTKT